MRDIATLTAKSQITIPKSVRSALHLRPHDRLLVTVQGDRIVMIPLRRQPLAALFGALPIEGEPLDMSALRRAVRRDLGRRIAEDEE